MNTPTVKQKLYGLFAAVLLAFAALGTYQLLRLNGAGLEMMALYSRDFSNANRVSELDGLLTPSVAQPGPGKPDRAFGRQAQTCSGRGMRRRRNSGQRGRRRLEKFLMRGRAARHVAVTT